MIGKNKNKSLIYKNKNKIKMTMIVKLCGVLLVAVSRRVLPALMTLWEFNNHLICLGKITTMPAFLICNTTMVNYRHIIKIHTEYNQSIYAKIGGPQ